MRAVQITDFGGPEVLELVDLPVPKPARGEVLIDVSRIGINFADTHQRENQYLAKQDLPLIPGSELSGRTADGRRVAAMPMHGAYAQQVVLPADSLVEVPDAVSDDAAAGILVQGLSAWGLLRLAARLEPGETIAIEGAAGGTGTLAVQLAKSLGARVIGLASSPEKRELVMRLGADATADSRAEEAGEALLEANGGRPVDAILQISGGSAFDQQMQALAPFGRMIAFGIATRKPNTVRSQDLMRSSRSVAGFWINHLLERPELVKRGITELLGAVASGELEVVIGGVYPMSDVANAHLELQERRTQGKLLLDPSK